MPKGKKWVAWSRRCSHDGQFQTHVRASRRDAPESCIYLPPQRGRGECRVPTAPAASCALCIGRTHTSNNEYTGTPGIPARNGFTAYVALSPVTGLFCHRRLRIRGLSAPGRADLPSRQLDASVGASGPHDFAVRSSISRQRAL
jgi:hypothetical protein